MTDRYGVTNASTNGFAMTTNDREAAFRCASFICGIVVDRETGTHSGNWGIGRLTLQPKPKL